MEVRPYTVTPSNSALRLIISSINRLFSSRKELRCALAVRSIIILTDIFPCEKKGRSHTTASSFCVASTCGVHYDCWKFVTAVASCCLKLVADLADENSSKSGFPSSDSIDLQNPIRLHKIPLDVYGPICQRHLQYLLQISAHVWWMVSNSAFKIKRNSFWYYRQIDELEAMRVGITRESTDIWSNWAGSCSNSRSSSVRDATLHKTLKAIECKLWGMRGEKHTASPSLPH